jgi:DNA-binding NarL/FixJ family response regulator
VWNRGAAGYIRRMAIRLTIVNDYEIIVQGLRRMLEPYADRIHIVETEAGGLPCVPCDVALFDTFAGRRHSLERVRQIAAQTSIGKVVLYTWDAPAAFLDDVSTAGIDAVISKTETSEDLVRAIELVHAGEKFGLCEARSGSLSAREREVLALIAQGATNSEIGRELYVSVDTVKTHVRNVFRKVGVSNRTQAALAAAEYGLASPAVR